MQLKYLVLVLLQIPIFLNAQSNYKEGYLVTQVGDTVYGFINYQEWHRNPDNISFKKTVKDSNAQTFTTNDIIFFTILGHESYSRHAVSISMDQVNQSSIKELYDTTTIKKTVFLREELKGDRVNLYSYQDKIKNRFYILDNGKKIPTELIFRKAMKDGKESTYPLYRQQLASLALSYGKLTPQLDHLLQGAFYSGRDFKKIVSKINSETIKVADRTEYKKRTLSIFAGAGLINHRIVYSGKSSVTIDGVDYRSSVSSTNYAPRVCLGMEFYFNAAIRRLAMRAEISTETIASTVKSHETYNDFSLAGKEYTYRFSGRSVSLTPQVIFNIYNSSKFKWYVGAGGTFSYFHANENSLEQKWVNQASQNEETLTDYFSFKSFIVTPNLRSGFTINERVDLSAVLNVPLKYTSNFSSEKMMDVSCFIFSASYYIKK